ISPLGGTERKVGDAGAPRSLSWMPDNHSLVISARSEADDLLGLYLMATGTGELRRLVAPPGNPGADVDPAVAPDGQRVAFVRYDNQADLYLLRIGTGEIRQLTHDKHYVSGPAWMNNDEIVFSSVRSGVRTLWRIGVDGRS